MTLLNTVILNEDGKDLKAYVARPASGKGPGIVLMHEVYGVTEGIKAIADYFAEQGFVVACPNMYWRDNPDAGFKYDPAPETMAAMPAKERIKLETQLAKDRDAARDCMFSILDDKDGSAKMLDTIEKVAAFLRQDSSCTGKVAASGFCFGARNAYIALSQKARGIDAGIAFYATPKLHEVFDMQATMAIDKPFMFVAGGEDPYINDDEKEDMIVASSSTTVTYVSGRKKPIIEENENGNPYIAALYYANSNHGFNRRDSKYSDPGTSAHVMRIATEFLQAALAEKPSFSLPAYARTNTPDSPTYHPAHKV